MLYRNNSRASASQIVELARRAASVGAGTAPIRAFTCLVGLRRASLLSANEAPASDRQAVLRTGCSVVGVYVRQGGGSLESRVES